MPLRSLLDRTTNLIRSNTFLGTTSTSTSASASTISVVRGGITTTSRDVLFPKVVPEVDGPDCMADCNSCTITYPKRFSISEDDEIYGNVKPWATHVLVATGKTDWKKDVTDETGSVMQALGRTKPNNGRMMLSASNILPSTDDDATTTAGATENGATKVLVLPSFTFVEGVRPTDVEELVRIYVDTSPTSTTPLDEILPISPPPNTTSHLRSRPCPHDHLILLCSQATRDARCGMSAPLLRKEFERHLRPLGLQRDLDDDRREGGVGIYFVSHVGGHKYAANVLVYRRRAQQAIWLARVRPQHCEAIVKFTVLQGKVVHPETMLRGGWDRGRAIVSW